MKKAWEVEGYVVACGEIYCVDCANEGEPIFTSSEWDTSIYCEDCGSELDVNVIGGKIKCPRCWISVPDVPEDASYEEMLCNNCYELLYE